MSTLFGGVSNVENRLPLQNVAMRIATEEEVIRRNNDNLSSGIRVSMPAKVVSFNATKQTIVAQPLIREKVINRATGAIQWLTLPQILDVPVQFPQGGGFVLTFPIQPNDEVLLIFQDMCMDGWFTSGGIQNWNMRRRHDLSDAIAIVGINSQPNVIGSIASNATELRSKDGTTKVSVKQVPITVAGVPFTESSTALIAGSANVTVTSTHINVGGVPTASNRIDLNGDVYHNGNNYLHHIHGGVTTGPGVSGAVTEVP